MLFYLAGPMRGQPHFNFNTFEVAYDYLVHLGHTVVSPHNIDIAEGLVEVRFYEAESPHTRRPMREFFSVELTDRFSIEEALRRDFKAICDADGVAFLPGHELSEGARHERQVNKWVGGVELFVRPWRYAAFSQPDGHGQCLT